MNIVFNPIGGISGDMILSSILNSLDSVKRESAISLINKIPLNFQIKYQNSEVNSISCGKIEIISSDGNSHRHLNDIINIVQSSEFSDSIKEKAIKYFSKIASIEANIHNKEMHEVHFHEIGGVDSIVDIFGIIILMEHLDIRKMYYIPPIPVNNSLIHIEHGAMPSLAPATTELLKDKEIRFFDEKKEMVTPTGALFLHFSNIIDLNFSYSDIGYGTGNYVFKNRPNLLRTFFINSKNLHKEFYEIEANIDDLSPQSISIFYDIIGDIALDVFITPIYMKKNRPAFKLTLLVKEEYLNKAIDFIFKNSTTIGLRFSKKNKIEQKRILSKIKTQYGIIDIKVLDNKVIPEFSQCLEISKISGVPVYKIIEEVRYVATKNY